MEIKLLKQDETESSIVDELRKGNIIEIFSNNSDIKKKLDNKNNSIPSVSLNFEKYITENSKNAKEISKHSENLNNVLQKIKINNLVKKNKPELINIAEKLKISINNDKGKPKTKAQLLVEIKKNLN